ncbi:hypothetical protein LTR08_006455 [Meristemomyces frigidus]|nr:hypothetical protein LTR08_006455 [Meristemomyces frigidus]
MSRFVAAGSTDEPTAQDEAWQEAQSRIEATRQKKPELASGQQSLYETLQANKAAKQDAFEEAARLRNQFRSLDEDEVDFLDSVLDSTRSKEAEVKKQTKEQLVAFRQQQEEAEKAAKLEGEGSAIPVAAEMWSVGPKKRKKAREGEAIGGVKFRRTSTAEKKEEGATGRKASATVAGLLPEAWSPNTGKASAAAHGKSSAPKEEILLPAAVATKPLPAPSTTLGLAAYSSDEDD